MNIERIVLSGGIVKQGAVTSQTPENYIKIMSRRQFLPKIQNYTDVKTGKEISTMLFEIYYYFAVVHHYIY